MFPISGIAFKKNIPKSKEQKVFEFFLKTSLISKKKYLEISNFWKLLNCSKFENSEFETSVIFQKKTNLRLKIGSKNIYTFYCQSCALLYYFYLFLFILLSDSQLNNSSKKKFLIFQFFVLQPFFCCKNRDEYTFACFLSQ